MSATKLCFGDGETQPQHVVKVSEFSADKTRDDGLCVYCRACNAARQRRWKHENPEKVRAAKRAYRKSQREAEQNANAR